MIKLPAADPDSRIGTLFINFGGPGQSGVDRLRKRARLPWLFSDELRSRFDLVSWDQRGVSRSAGVRCFSSELEQWQFLVPSPGLPTDARGEQDLFAWAQEFAERCTAHAGPILDHASSANTARDLELLRRSVGEFGLELSHTCIMFAAGRRGEIHRFTHGSDWVGTIVLLSASSSE